MDSLEKRFQNIEINRNRLIPPKEKIEKQRSKSKFKNFAMVNKNYEKQFIELAQKHPHAINIFIYLIFNRNKYNNECKKTIKNIMENLNISKHTIIDNLKYLESYDFIKIFKENTSNFYIINNFIVKPINNNCLYHIDNKTFTNFNNFFKINYTLKNKDIINNIINQSKYALTILIFLLFNMDKSNKIIICKKDIKEKLKISKFESFETAIKVLEESNFLKAQRDIKNKTYIFYIDDYFADTTNN